MVKESDIVKQLRKDERLGLLKSKTHDIYEIINSDQELQDNNAIETDYYKGKKLENKYLDNVIFIENYEILYKSIFENCPDSIIVLDMEGIIKTCNPATYRNLGYSKYDMINKYFYKFGKINKNDIPNLLKIFESVLQEKITEPFELNIYSKDGKIILAEICVCLLKYNKKKIGILAIIKDITEQKKAEEELDNYHKKQDLKIKESTSKLQKEVEKNKKVREELFLKNIVFESSAAANSTADINGNINFANLSFLKLWGYGTKDEIIGKSMSFFFQNEEDASKIIESLNKLGKWEGEFIAKRKDGSTFVTKCFAIIVKNDKDEIIGYYSTNIDFSDQKKIEEELIKNRFESEEKYKALFKASADGILIFDLKTKKLQLANPAFQKMFGFNEKEISKLSLKDIQPKESLKFFISEINNQINDKKLLFENITCLRKDGTTFFADINLTTILLNGIKCNAGFFREVTDRKKYEEELKEKIVELERWKKVTVGRELHMKKLKETIKNYEKR